MPQDSTSFLVSILTEINQEQKNGTPVTFERMCQIAGNKTFERWEETKQQPKDLLLQGRATDSIWVISDGQEPYKLGLRLDCGDAGAVYLTLQQARQIVNTLTRAIAIETADKN